jgi:hypothetical protein
LLVRIKRCNEAGRFGIFRRRTPVCELQMIDLGLLRQKIRLIMRGLLTQSAGCRPTFSESGAGTIWIALVNQRLRLLRE